MTGSKDGTAQALMDAFDLVEVPIVVPQDVPTKGLPQSVHVPADGHTPAGAGPVRPTAVWSSAINVGVNAARYPLMAIVDADSILDPDALLVVSKPFADDPQRVVATGGVIRAVNGCRVVAGRVVEVAMPRGGWPASRSWSTCSAFLIGRTGWSRVGTLMIVSGRVRPVPSRRRGRGRWPGRRLHRRGLRAWSPRSTAGCATKAGTIGSSSSPSRSRGPRSRRPAPSWPASVGAGTAACGRCSGSTGGCLNGRYGRIGLIGLPYFWLFEFSSLPRAGVLRRHHRAASGSCSAS